MSFNKRWINRDNIIARYKERGIEGVKQTFKADALFFNDDFSRDIHNLLLEGDNLKITNRIKQEINDGESI